MEKKDKYKVEIRETLIRVVEVEAEDLWEAERKVRDMYRHEEIVLDSEDYCDTEFRALEQEVGKW